MYSISFQITLALVLYLVITIQSTVKAVASNIGRTLLSSPDAKK